MTLRFGLKETTIQKICGVFAKYQQVEKAVLQQISDPDVTDHIRRVGVVFYEKETETSHA